jgi:hypothetical protein
MSEQSNGTNGAAKKDPLERTDTGLPTLATRLFESLGILNKGSASLSTGELKHEDATKKMAVVENSFNVTRVGGLAATITAVGVASIAIFNVDRATDATGVVVAAYASSGFIVGAALITVAIIISADIRARGTAAAKPDTAADSADKSKSDPAIAGKEVKELAAAPTSPDSFKATWRIAIERLELIEADLPAVGGESGAAYVPLSLDAEAAAGLTKTLVPTADMRDKHARMGAAQQRVSALLQGLQTKRDDESEVQCQIRTLIKEARTTLVNLP